MADKNSRVRSQSDGQGSPALDGQPIENEILLSLSAKERDLIFPQLTFMDLATHTVLHESGEPIKFGYFLNQGLASVLTVLAEGKSVEVGLTGKEGFVGLPLIVGFTTSPTRAVIQIAANGFRINARNLVLIMRQAPGLERHLQRYVQILGMQGTQVAACNRLHEVDERLARWLLMCQDRIGSNFVPLTQEFLAHMLGTRRASVTVAAGMLQKAGIITYQRGHVNVVDRPQLENASCECYEMMQEQIKKWRGESH
ncbi:MAG TPA: Crp/Fnr family transcriptional regulator [Terriglobales bacterium]|jgi:CRP-like cAMP-binding protein|nr:Crp/Fnr family transcriptional regulator [Terriglobales bacterium]